MNQTVGDLELLEEIVLGDARGGRKPSEPLSVAIVRSLSSEDMPLLLSPPPVKAPPQRLQSIRHSHHQLAQLIAQGKPDQEISLITGYSPAYISSLKGGADFQGLLAYYGEQKEMIFVEVMERMKVLGLNSIDEIQARFEENPASFTNGQLFELVELMIIKPAKVQADAPRGGAAVPVTVNVNFVKGSDQIEAEQVGEVIDVRPSFGILR